MNCTQNGLIRETENTYGRKLDVKKRVIGENQEKNKRRNESKKESYQSRFTAYTLLRCLHLLVRKLSEKYFLLLKAREMGCMQKAVMRLTNLRVCFL